MLSTQTDLCWNTGDLPELGDMGKVGLNSRECAPMVAAAGLQGGQPQQALQVSGLGVQRLTPQPPCCLHSLTLCLHIVSFEYTCFAGLGSTQHVFCDIWRSNTEHAATLASPGCCTMVPAA